MREPINFKAKNVIIFDLDGTLSLTWHRKHFVERPEHLHDSNCPFKILDTCTEGSGCKCAAWKPDWDAFFDACDGDDPNEPIIALNRMLYQQGYTVVIFSGRIDRVSEKTRDWLLDHGCLYHYLVMRKEKDFRADHIIKKEMLETSIAQGIFTKEEILFVVDDRKTVVSMWRSLGLTCLQVADGNF